MSFDGTHSTLCTGPVPVVGAAELVVCVEVLLVPMDPLAQRPTSSNLLSTGLGATDGLSPLESDDDIGSSSIIDSSILKTTCVWKIF